MTKIVKALWALLVTLLIAATVSDTAKAVNSDTVGWWTYVDVASAAVMIVLLIIWAVIIARPVAPKE